VVREEKPPAPRASPWGPASAGHLSWDQSRSSMAAIGGWHGACRMMARVSIWPVSRCFKTAPLY